MTVIHAGKQVDIITDLDTKATMHGALHYVVITIELYTMW